MFINFARSRSKSNCLWEVKVSFLLMCTTWTLFQCHILDRRFAKTLNTQRKEVVDIFKMLDAMRWSLSPKVATKRIKINGIPSRITPLFGLLNLKTLVISVDMKAHTLVVLEVAEFCLFNEDFGRKYMWSCGILSFYELFN